MHWSVVFHLSFQFFSSETKTSNLKRSNYCEHDSGISSPHSNRDASTITEKGTDSGSSICESCLCSATDCQVSPQPHNNNNNGNSNNNNSNGSSAEFEFVAQKQMKTTASEQQESNSTSSNEEDVDPKRYLFKKIINRECSLTFL